MVFRRIFIACGHCEAVLRRLAARFGCWPSGWVLVAALLAVTSEWCTLPWGREPRL